MAPQGFTGVELSDIDVWIPIAAANGLRFAKGSDWATTRSSQWVSIIARLKPGATMAHAEAQATLVRGASGSRGSCEPGAGSTRFESGPHARAAVGLTGVSVIS